ncbi:hypothetical protein OpiT1DRAFT_02652 [Opitutaceae bacterium TAV1]|nr:hypothetical protein OpiT1DRAFT_02652 [Opitutaceae bacterium TAV1]
MSDRRRHYESHLSSAAAAFVIGLPRCKQRLVLDLADQLAAHPFQVSDYRETDAAGRMVENLLCDGYLFSYWVDHASREVRITDIIKI